MRRTLGPILALAAMLAATPAHAACSMGWIAELPVTMMGLRPMVPAKIDGRESLFLADSGAFYSMITPGTAAEHKLRLAAAPAGYRLTGIGGSTIPSITVIKTFSLADQLIPDLTFLVAGSETGGAGVIGQNVLGLADVEYDLAGGMIRLVKTRDCAKTNLAYWAKGKPVSIIRISDPGTVNKHTIGTVFVNGQALRALFDTGASTSLLTLQAAARAGVRPGDPGVVSVGYARGLGRQTVPAWIGPFASFQIGDEEVRKTRLRFADVGSGGDYDMLIGADFFLSHRVFVANSQRLLFLTYNGGQVFNLAREVAVEAPGGAAGAEQAAAPPADAAEPVDADGYARRGAARAARRDLAGGIADLGRAIELAPNEPRYLSQRASMRLANRQPLLAKADLDQALKLKPDDVATLMTRGAMQIFANDAAGGRADLDAAARVAAPAADQRFALAALYERIEAFDQAIAQLDLWIAAHRQDSRQPNALNSRCWARALAGRELDKALDDCNASLRLRPKIAQVLDSRGLVRLRMGDLDRAIEDYDAVLAGNPKMAWSLYGRGVARLRKGQTPEGRSDLAASAAIDPGLASRARKYGIVPPS